MELEELKNAWKELNTKLSQNELTNRNVLMKMLQRQKESSVQRVWRIQLVTIPALVLVWFGTGFVWAMEGYDRFPGIAIYLLFFSFVLTVLGIHAIYRVKQIRNGSQDLEVQLHRILKYKALQGWMFVANYVLVIPFMILLLYYLYSIQLLLCICLIIPICFIIDYFTYQHIVSSLRTITASSRELEEFNKETR